MEIINNKIRRGGRKPSNIWIYFNDEEDSLNKISGVCKHCRTIITHWKKTATIVSHLNR